MAQPKCPECSVKGVKNILLNLTQSSVAPYEVIYCDKCGHIYGVFPKREKEPQK